MRGDSVTLDEMEVIQSLVREARKERMEDKSKLDRIEVMLQDVLDTLKGSPRDGDIGLIARVGKIETKVNLAYTLGGMVVAAFGFCVMTAMEWMRLSETK